MGESLVPILLQGRFVRRQNKSLSLSLFYLAPPDIWRIWRWVGAAGVVIYPHKQRQHRRDRS